MIKTRQQKRAEFAIKQLYSENNSTYEVNKNLASFIVRLPTMLLSNGLGQTMAFLASKKENKDRFDVKITYQIIQNYIFENTENYPSFKDIVNKKFENEIEKDYNFLTIFNQLSSKEYIELQEDILRMLEWLKRYARAFSTSEEKQGE